MSTAPSNLTNAAVMEYASQVGAHHRIYKDAGCADIAGLLEKLGGKLEYALDSESLDVEAPGKFTIYLPQATSNRRDRFTIAHELGHYFLHYLYPGLTGPKRFGRGNRNRAETEANVFASALLMPQAEFERAYRQVGGDEWELAVLFDVSPAAAGVRAQVLNL